MCRGSLDRFPKDFCKVWLWSKSVCDPEPDAIYIECTWLKNESIDWIVFVIEIGDGIFVVYW
jgi:hypothetical protein